MRALAAAVLASFAAACGVPAHGPTMEPGRDCLECHNHGEGEPAFTAAGTVYWNATDGVDAGVKGARVHLVDANGRAVTVTSNKAGNFYTRERLAFPLQVVVERGGVVSVMSDPVPDGACNACHTVPPPAPTQLARAAPGRVALIGGSGDEFMLPGWHCLSCHRPGGAAQAKPFSSAGTVFGANGAGAEGVTVTIVDAQGRTFERVTNRVGNFFFDEPIAFGDAARVRISQGALSREMDELTEGSCNRCHAPGGEEGRVSLTGGEAGDD